jgi:Sulfotransferase domain
MLAELLTGSEVDFCSEDEVVPHIGRHLPARRTLPGNGRLIKTHEPYQVVYKRAIYLVRDVRDVALSFRKLRYAEGFDDESFADFLIRFVKGDIGGFGSWQAHVDSWLVAASNLGPDMLVVRYEEIIDDPVAKLGDMARFLGVPADNMRLRKIVENNRPGKMRGRRTPYSDERMKLTIGAGTYNNWQTQYTESELVLLEPAMKTMRRAGYAVEERLATKS